MNEQCCNHNCNQGRDCPLRKKDETLDTRSYLIGRYDTSPVKELTDEEIRALWNPMPDTKVYVRDLIEFARAILRKAQEK
jgi:hypothetical protein